METRLAKLLWEVGREVVELAFNQCEPSDPGQMPARLRIGWDEYRRGKQTGRNMFCLFGQIRLRRWLYQPLEAGERSVFPVELSLGIIEHLATAALADQVGRLSAELTQPQTREVLAQRFSVVMSVGSLRKVAASVAKQLIPLRQECQVQRLAAWLSEAFESDGPHHPALVVGRDGVMVPGASLLGRSIDGHRQRLQPWRKASGDGLLGPNAGVGPSHDEPAINGPFE